MKKDVLNRLHYHKKYYSKNNKISWWFNFRPISPRFGFKFAIDFNNYVEIEIALWFDFTLSIIWNNTYGA